MSTSSKTGRTASTPRRRAKASSTKSPARRSAATTASAKRAPAKKTTAKKKTVKKVATAKPTAAKKAKAPAAKSKTASTRKRGPAVAVDPDALEFIEAIDRFKRDHQKPFPTWSEVLWVVKSLGYRKRG